MKIVKYYFDCIMENSMSDCEEGGGSVLLRVDIQRSVMLLLYYILDWDIDNGEGNM